MRCEKHGLATADDGMCVLCRREARGAPRGGRSAVAVAPAEAPDSTWVGPNLLLLGMVAVAMAFFLVARSQAGLGPVAPAPQPQRIALANDDELELPGHAGGADEADAIDALGDRFDQYDRVANMGDDEAEARHRAALEAVEVNVYYTTWCPACKTARKWLKDHDVPFRGYDVERDSAAARRLRELNPRGAIPTIEIDGKVTVGFDQRRIEQMLSTAAKKRFEAMK